ncbi:MAG: right-handed parallel beta-helix repeat-containing protein [Pseudomonadota bacterium]
MNTRPVVVAAALLLGQTVGAATLEVDRIDDDPGATACTATPIDCSLRGAIMFAELNPGPDTILLPGDTITLTTEGTGAASEGDFDIASSITIEGAGMGRSVIMEGPAASFLRAFDVHEGGSLTLLDLTVTGFGTTSFAHGGGAIRMDADSTASMTLRRVHLLDNRAPFGGAIFADPDDDPAVEPQVQIFDSVIEANVSSVTTTSPCTGGGLFLRARTIIESTDIIDNSALRGGGICVRDTDLELRTVTLSGNTFNVSQSGGALYAVAADVVISGSRIINNGAVTGVGGAVRASGGTLTVSNTRISDNESRGAVLFLEDSVNADFADSRIADNTTFPLAAFDAQLNFDRTDVTASVGAGFELFDTFVTGQGLTMSGFSRRLGGAIFGDNSALNLEECVFRDNRAVNVDGEFSGAGGAIYLEGGALDFRGCTLADNQADAVGGAIVMSGGLVLALENSTFSNNVSAGPSAIQAANLMTLLDLDHVTITSPDSGASVQALNADSRFSNSAIDGACELFFGGGLPISLGGNVVTDATCQVDPLTDTLALDLELQSLGDFGGPTPVILPAPTSPVLGAVADCVLTVDQRGEPRSSPCDAGAVEIQPTDDAVFADSFEL